jgi:pseudouridine-5'-phosphate glycosidase
VLDLPATLEWLETHGVPVLGFRTDRFPAFYSQTAEPPLHVDARVDTAQEVAAIFRARQRLGLRGGVLVCVPVPAGAALSADEVETAIRTALEEAVDRGITGRAITPFLLGALARLTQGRSLAANRALLENNAAVAADISRAISPPRYV